MSYFVLLTMVFLVFVGGVSSNQMFHPVNRPMIFRGGVGTAAFGLCNFIIMFSIISLIIWGFFSFTWYVAIGVILGGFAVSAVITTFLPGIILANAFGPMVCAVALLFLNAYAWAS